MQNVPKIRCQDVVGGGGAGDFVERAQGVVEIEQQHFVRHAGGDCAAGGVERGERFVHQLLVADVGEKSAFDLRCAASLLRRRAQNRRAQLVDAVAGERRGLNRPRIGGDWRADKLRTSQITLVRDDDARSGLPPG